MYIRLSLHYLFNYISNHDTAFNISVLILLTYKITIYLLLYAKLIINIYYIYVLFYISMF